MSNNEIKLKNLKEGIDLCVDLVENLLKDSEILLKKKRYSSSTSLAILAFEEISKASVMYSYVSEGKDMPLETWRKLSRGGEAHNFKLSVLMLQRKIFLKNKPSPKVDAYVDEINRILGFPELAEHRMAQIQTQILEKVLPRLNIVKKECFYLNLDEGNKDWIYFDIRFKEYAKKAIATFLIILTKRITALHKFYSYIPSKSFDQYTVKEWNMALKSKQRKELEKTLKKTNKKHFGRLTDQAILALLNYPGESIFDIT